MLRQSSPCTTPVPKQIIWQVPPDDFSINTVEFFVKAPVPAGVQALRISPPAGAGFVIAIKENHWAAILRAGQIVAILARFPDVGANARLRLSLAPTGWQCPGILPCPSGDWTVSFARKDDVSLWILRDNRDFMLDGPLQRRASAFYDEAYELRDPHGTYFLIDHPGSAVVRSGTISILATAKVKGPALVPDQPVCDRVVAVQANEQMIGLLERQAFYSGRRVDDLAIEKTALVDWGRPASGVQVAANGTQQPTRMTGTSAAVALYGRRHLRIPPDAL